MPSSGATVAGTRVILDAGASAGVTQVKFELTAAQLVYAVLFAAPTYYGWITLWNSTTLRDGTYTLTSIATEGGSSAASPGISITVSNGSPSVSIVVPSSGATVSGKHAVLDAVASPGVSQVTFDLIATGCPNVSTIFPPIYICAIGGVPTIYGWIGTFDSTDWANGSYPLFTIAAYPSGQGSAGPEAMSTVDVDNQAQPTVVVRRTTPPCPALRCSTAPHVWHGGSRLVRSVGRHSRAGYGHAHLLRLDIRVEHNGCVTNGRYSLNCNATYIYGGGGKGPAISITVSN